jgi:hypothetical protein
MYKLFLAGILSGLALATPLAAQRPSGPSFGITPYAGYMRFGNLASGPFGTTVRNAGSAVYGAEATLGLTNAIALVGSVAYAQPGLEVGAPLIGDVSVGRGSVLLYDGALRLRVPVTGLPISPFLQAGAGAVRQSLDIGPASTHSTNIAYNIGAGADVALGSRLGLQFMVKDYIGKFDSREAASVDIGSETTHNVAVSAGLRLGF